MHFLDGLGQFLYILLIYALLDLTLGIRFEPVLGGLSSMQIVRLNKNNII